MCYVCARKYVLGIHTFASHSASQSNQAALNLSILSQNSGVVFFEHKMPCQFMPIDLYLNVNSIISSLAAYCALDSALDCVLIGPHTKLNSIIQK